MDVKEVTGIDEYRKFFEQLKQAATRATLRNGELVRHHPDPRLLVFQFMAKLAQKDGRVSQAGMGTISPSQVPPSYLPCVMCARDLSSLMISNMRIGEHHRGRRALIHVLTPSDRMTAVMAIVEDEEGTAVLLQLYNQPEEDQVSHKQILKQGDVCIVKDPFFKATIDGAYSLRVDHVSDIIWLADTDERIPWKWRKRVLSLDETSQDIRKQGNAAVKEGDWATAERLYTQASRTATTPEETRLAHLNRALANLRLDRPEKALDDARRGSGAQDVADEKPLFREAKALYSLGRFKACMEKLLALVRCNPKNTEAWAEIKRVKQRLREQETGSYDFDGMFRQAAKTPPLVDCATYIGPVAVRDSGGRGKGLFTTRPVKAGELLFCEKAFAYCYAGEDSPTGRSNTTILMNMDNNTVCVGGQARLITQVVQKIYHNPSAADVFTDLHHGDYAPVTTREVDGAPVVDTFLVVKIIELNVFGAPRSTYENLKFVMDGAGENGGERDASYTTCGIWPVASRINHSCVTNCRRSFIGDMQVVRACQDLEADTELCFGYQPPLRHQNYEETQKKLKKWGFVCDCVLCLDKKSTPQGTLERRRALNNMIKLVLKPGASMAQLRQTIAILESLEKTYIPREGVSPVPVPRLELWDPYFALGAQLISKKQLADGLEMLIRGLEALGFVIAACPPRLVTDEKDRKMTTLEIKHWGQATEFIAGAFLGTMPVYEVLAPELRRVAKEYARVAYTICWGENGSIGTLDPQLV